MITVDFEIIEFKLVAHQCLFRYVQN